MSKVEIVQHFHVRRRLVKEHLGAARERLDVGRVLGQQRNDFLGQAVLAADVRQRVQPWIFS